MTNRREGVASVFEKWSIRLTTLAGGAAVVVITLVALWVTADVVARYFRHPIRGTLELSEFGVGIMAWLFVGYTQLRRGHVEITLLLARLSNRTRAILDIIYSCIALLVWLCVGLGAIYGALLTINLTTDFMALPTFPFKMVIPLGSLLMILMLITGIINAAKTMRSK